MLTQAFGAAGFLIEKPEALAGRGCIFFGFPARVCDVQSGLGFDTDVTLPGGYGESARRAESRCSTLQSLSGSVVDVTGSFGVKNCKESARREAGLWVLR